jgi:hypothetical protein
MKEPTPAQPLRGEAAFRARKAEITKRNEQAWANGATQRAAREARLSEQQLAEAKRERASLPRQPNR